MRAVHVLEDLRDRHHQAGGGGPLGGERPEIHRHRLHVVQERVDRGEVRAALGRVGRLAFEVDDAADRVVDLAGVEPEMRQRVREPVRGDARAQDRHRALVGLRLRRGDRAGEPGQQRRRIGLRPLALDDQREREAVHGLQRRRVAEPGRHRELAVDGTERPLGQAPHHAGGGDGRQAAHHPVELHALRFEAVAEGVPPADIRAPVGVAADPAGDGEGFRHKLGPAVGPAPARGVEQRAVEGVHRVAAVIGGDAGLLELAVEGDRRVGPGRELRRRLDQRAARLGVVEARGLGEQGGHRLGHAEGRMRGEHHRERRAPDPVAEALEGAGPVRHRRDEARRHRRVGIGMVRDADIAAQPRRAVGERLGAQANEQRVEVVLRDLAAVEAPGDRQRHRQHGVAERVLARLLARRLDQSDEMAFELLRVTMGKRSHRSGSERIRPSAAGRAASPAQDVRPAGAAARAAERERQGPFRSRQAAAGPMPDIFAESGARRACGRRMR